jgi:hypothetical protein
MGTQSYVNSTLFICIFLDFLPEGEFGLLVEELSPGLPLRQIENTDGMPIDQQEEYRLNGQLLKLTYNQFDILRPIRQLKGALLQTTTSARSTSRLKKVNTISLNNENSFAQYQLEMRTIELFSLYVKFKTIASSGILFALVSNSSTTTGTYEIVVSLELIRGKIRYRFGQTTVIAPESTRKKRVMNDLKWHAISIREVIIV